MSIAIADQKKTLREAARAKIKAISRPDQAKGAAAACELLNPQEIWKQANVVLMYWPIAGEVDLRPMLTKALEENKTALLPRFAPERGCYIAARIRNPDSDLRPGPFGVLEPTDQTPEQPLATVDLALVPGIAFDRQGGRLGRGRGFYDRILAQVRGVKCGVAFASQVLPTLPIEEHDILMDYLLTPDEFTRCDRP